MPATSEGLSFVAADVEVSNDGICWLAMSCHATSIAVTGGDRSTGEQNVFCAEVPILKPGKLNSQEVTIRYVYTEEAPGCPGGGPFESIRLWHEQTGGPMYVRYWPKSKDAGNFLFETGLGIITKFDDPGGEAGPGDVVQVEVTVKAPRLSKSAWVS